MPRPVGDHTNVRAGLVAPPSLKPGQRLLSIPSRPKEDADEVARRVAGYQWGPRVVSGPFRTGLTRWSWVVRQ